MNKDIKPKPRGSIVAEKKEKRNYTLSQYAAFYFREHKTSVEYRLLTMARCRKFCEWYGEDMPIAVLNCEILNEYIECYLEAGAKAHTVDGHRRSILAVWNFAYMNGDNDNPALRLKKVKTQRSPVEAYTHEEIRRLLEHAATLRAYMPNGIAFRDFWVGIIHAAYSTGLRRGDLLRVKRSDIGENGVAIILQNKTQYPVAVRFSPDAMAAINRMAYPADDPFASSRPDRAFKWPFHENALCRQFRAIAKSSGVCRGSFRWLRRSAGSYAELQQPGNGQRLLGHRNESVFRNHYQDMKITTTMAVEPPTITLPAVTVAEKMGHKKAKRPSRFGKGKQSAK